MDKLIIEGGVALEGEVEAGGAKNAALPIIASALLASGESVITNVPLLRDITTISKLLETMGVNVERSGDALKIDAASISNPQAPYELVKTMRASVLVLGPLVARCGEAFASLPGGCAIGARPIDLHLKGLEALGADVRLEHGYVHATAKKLTGAKFVFDTVTVTGTENIMMAAATAQAETILENAAREPEVVDLASALNSMGAKINGAGTDTITIEGVDALKPLDGYAVMPDRIEVATFLAAGAITAGDVTVRGARAEHLEAVTSKLAETGAEISLEDDGMRVRGPQRPLPTDVRTLPFPGFPTDMQAQMMALLSVAGGLSVISETIFENRFMHVSELVRLGADIVAQGRSAVVRGVENLDGAPVMATDLRASASLVLAGLRARGTTEISRIYHLDRGYETIEKKLGKIGAKIKRIKNEK